MVDISTFAAAIAIALSNGHLILWNGPIQVGNQEPQDGGGGDGETTQVDDDCTAFPDWRKYDAFASSTYEIASDNADLNYLNLQYQDGEWVRPFLRTRLH